MEQESRLEVMEKSTGSVSIEGRYHRFNKLLGKGAYKCVWKAFDTISQVDVAWNSIDLSAMTDNEKDKVFSECEMLQKLNHGNILKIRDRWSNKEREELCFVTDVIQNGSLRSYFKKRKINLKKLKEICRQILLALEYLHSNAVIHRDLKCDNIFIDSNNSKVVLGDLGLSVTFNGQSRMSIVGTPHWMAPELYNEKYNELVDIWSFGMCVLELCTNTIPYKECKNTIAVYNKVMIEKRKPDVLFTLNDPYVRSFIKICLDFNPQLRPTAKELLLHPFLLSRYPRDYAFCDNMMKNTNKYDENMSKNVVVNKNINTHMFIDNNNNLKPPKKSKNNKKRNSKSNKKSSKHKTDVKVQNVVSKRNITTIKLQIYRKDDKPMAVTFDFNMNIDRAADVAQEMIQELKLPQIYRSKVENAINCAIESENNHKTQIVGQSLIMKRSMVEENTKGKDAEIKNGDNDNGNDIDIRNGHHDNNANDTELEIDNDLVLEDLSSCLGGEISVEIEQKQKEQIVKKRDELLKEYADFIETKQELLKLKIEAITETTQREEEIAKMKGKVEKKKKETMQQYENYINDHKAIAQYTLTNMAQNFNFEKDKKYQFFMQSAYLTQNDKYKLEHILKDKRQEIVDDYLSFYENLIKKYRS